MRPRNPHLALRFILIAGLALLANLLPKTRAALAQCPDPSWIATFGGDQGIDAPIECIAEHLDGSIRWTVVGGDFTRAGSSNCLRIARWDGSAWSPMGAGFNGVVYSIATAQVAGTTSLFAAGAFTSTGGTPMNRIARWTGSSWTPLGNGLNGAVYKILGHNDGSGDALYAVGDFTIAGGVSASRIARWNGTGWSALGTGLNGPGNALAAYNDGAGNALFVGGGFISAGGVAVSRLAKWNGSNWSDVGGGVVASGGNIASVRALTTHNDGTGNKLIVAGEFVFAGPIAANRIAQWNGSSWSTFGSGFGTPSSSNSSVSAVLSMPEGGANVLYAAGLFTTSASTTVNYIARWSNGAWQPLGTGLNNWAVSLAKVGPVGAAQLVVGGHFTSTGSRLVRWTGSGWSTYGDGPCGPVGHVASVPSGPAAGLYAMGLFPSADGGNIRHAARWTGSGFAPIGPGLTGPLDRLDVLTLGGETALYAAAPHFGPPDIGTPTYVAKWTGTNWSAIPGVIFGAISAMTTFHDGASEKLVVSTNGVGGRPLNPNRVMRWNGSYWDGFGTAFPGSGVPTSLCGFNEPQGTTLYVGGSWSNSGFSTRGLYRWRPGTNWQLVTDGPGSLVHAMIVFDDGSGPALYAAGSFTTLGDLACNRVARWNGTTWSNVGLGFNGSVSAFRIHDDGSGPALYASGSFTASGAQPVRGVARWNGTTWTALGAGLTSGNVGSLASVATAEGPVLLAAGSFAVSPDGDSFLAAWRCVPSSPCIGDINRDNQIDAADVTAVLAAWGTCGVPGCAGDVNGDGVINAQDLTTVIAAWGRCPP